MKNKKRTPALTRTQVYLLVGFILSLSFFLFYHFRLSGVPLQTQNEQTPKETIPAPLPPQYQYLRKFGFNSIHIIFSTSCAPYNKWQAQLLVHSHRALRYPGRITEILSCNNTEWAHFRTNYKAYTLVRVPDFGIFPSGHNYPPRNKPQGLKFFFEKFPDFIKDDEMVVMVDPDMVLLADWPDLEVTRGRPAATAYSSGLTFLDLAPKFCGGTTNCDRVNIPEEARQQLEIGTPYVFHPADLRLLVPAYAEVLDEIDLSEEAKQKWGWIIEMHAFTISTLRLKLYHRRFPLMVSLHSDDREPWGLIQPSQPPKPPLAILHYCQKISVGNYSWTKHNFREDYLDCSRKGEKHRFPTAREVPELPGLIDELRSRTSLASQPGEGAEGRKRTFALRDAWLYQMFIPPTNDAFDLYHKEFC